MFSSISLVLKFLKNWQQWYLNLYVYANTFDIWSNIDLEREFSKNLSESQSSLPHAVQKRSHYDENDQLLAASEFEKDLIDIERHKLRDMRRDYELKLQRYRDKLKERKKVRQHIISTIFFIYLSESQKQNRLYLMLRELRSKLKSIAQSRAAHWKEKYKTIQKSRKQNVKVWIHDWIQIVSELQRLKRILDCDVRENFLNANKNLNLFYTNIVISQIQRNELNDQNSSIFKNLFNEFLVNYWVFKIINSNSASINSAFSAPTLKRRTEISERNSTSNISNISSSFNSSPNSSGTKRRSKSRVSGERECLCGMKHEFKDCYYIVKSIRPSEWKENKIVIEKMKTNLTRVSHKVKKIIQHVREVVKKERLSQQENHSTTSFDTATVGENNVFSCLSSQIIFALRDSWIDDNAADTHITNQRHRMLNFEFVSDQNMYTGDNLTVIERYEISYVMLNDSNDSFKHLLKHTVYVSDFHTNIVSLQLIKRAQFFFDTKTEVLQFKKTPFAQAKTHYFMSVFEYNSIKLFDLQTVTSQSSELTTNFQINELSVFVSNIRRFAISLHSSSTLNLWHKRMRHIHEKALRHLSKVTTDVSITDLNKSRKFSSDYLSSRCESCELFKSTQQIFKRSHIRVNRSFLGIHLDLIQFDSAYNADRWLFHYICDCTRFQLTLSHLQKSDFNEDTIRVIL